MFRFDSISDFIQMGGHGPYVWSAYLISVSVIIWLILSPLRRKRQFFREMARQHQRELERQQDAKGTPSISAE